MWLFLAIVSMLFSAVRRGLDKKLTAHLSNLPMAFAVNLFALLPIACMLFFFPVPHSIHDVPMRFWIVLVINCVILYPFQIYTYLHAIRNGEVSSVIPLTVFTPVFNAVTSLLVLGERPSIFGIFGIAVIVIGAYVLLRKKGPRGNIWPEILMILSMLIFAVNSSLDKVAIEASTVAFYTFINACVCTVTLFFCVLAARQSSELRKIKEIPGKIFWNGMLMGIGFITLEGAFALGNTSYVLAIRTGSLVLVALWGIWKLKEDASSRKMIAIIAFIAGSFLLAFA